MKPFRHQTALYVAAFLLALAVRLIRLGTWTLTDTEAQWALQALGVVQGAHPVLGSQPAYVLLTSIVFFFYGGGTNFLARFVPALAGSFLVFVPFLFRERLKPRPSLILRLFPRIRSGLGCAIASSWQFDPRRNIPSFCMGLLATEAASFGRGICRVGFAFGISTLGRLAWSRTCMGNLSGAGGARENGER